MSQPATFPPFATEGEERIDALGETALLRCIRGWLGDATPPSPQGIGDDCAVWPRPPQGAQLIFTTDAVVYGRHFDATCPPELAAAKLLKRNLSDIAAMGGTPHSALLALTLPRNLSLLWLERFYLGLRECSLRYATPVTGGDITEGTDNFFAAHITLIGHAQRPLLRTGAKAGDHLFVTGALGGSIHGHHLHFEPRLPEGQWLAAQPDVRSMIDITDGLAKDLPELLEAGSTGSADNDGSQSGAITGAIAGTQATIALLDLTALPLTAAAQASATVTQNAASARTQGCSSTQQTSVTRTQDATIVPRIRQRGKDQTSVTCTYNAVSEVITTGTASAKQSAAATPMASGITPATPATCLPQPITHALYDGEDYELLFTVDGATDPAEFISRWQSHFGQPKLPTPSAATSPTLQKPATGQQPATPASPQPAFPYRIGQIAAARHSATVTSIGSAQAVHAVTGSSDIPAANTCRLYDAATGLPLPLIRGGFEHL